MVYLTVYLSEFKKLQKLIEFKILFSTLTHCTNNWLKKSFKFNRDLNQHDQDVVPTKM